MITAFFLIALLAMLIGVPIAISLGLASMFYIIVSGIPPVTILLRLFSGINATALLAIPFFVLAGNLMNNGGIAKHLVRVANVFLGRFRGNLAIVAVGGCMFFSAIAGSGVATAAAMSTILIPEMDRANYDRTFSGSIVAATSPLGIILPPSIALILFGVLTESSVTSLFFWGIPTGLFIGLCLFAFVAYKAKKMGLEGSDKRYTAREKLLALKDASWALGTPIIILGGVFGGIFTPTESAVVAVVYALIIESARVSSWEYNEAVEFEANRSAVGA